jgi:hypothetical protein
VRAASDHQASVNRASHAREGGIGNRAEAGTPARERVELEAEAVAGEAMLALELEQPRRVRAGHAKSHELGSRGSKQPPENAHGEAWLGEDHPRQRPPGGSGLGVDLGGVLVDARDRLHQPHNGTLPRPWS